METRVQRLEDGVNDLKTEIRLVSQTLSSINETLIEFKTITRSVNALDMKLQVQDKDIESLVEKTTVLFKKVEKNTDAIETITKSDISQNIKVGGAEKFLWIVVTSLVGIAVGFFGGK